MEIIKGQIVRSISGHDKGLFLVVIGLDGNFALIADGKCRKVEKPKRKSLKHLGMTNTTIELDNLTNKKLRSVLNSYNSELTVTN